MLMLVSHHLPALPPYPGRPSLSSVCSLAACGACGACTLGSVCHHHQPTVVRKSFVSVDLRSGVEHSSVQPSHTATAYNTAMLKLDYSSGFF